MHDTTLTDIAELYAAGWAEDGAKKLAFGVVPAYRRFELRQARYLDLVPGLREMAERHGTLRILDIGSGLGSVKRFADHAGVRAYWHAIEIDPRRAQLCRIMGYQEIEDDHNLEEGPLPYGDETFHVVVASHILEHVVDDTGALADWYRVLKPGGLLMLGVPMHLPPIAALAQWRYRRVGRRPFGHCQFYSMGALHRLLDRYPVRSARGFRAFSARKQLPLEDYRWFFEASMAFGRRWPALTQEVNVEIEKPAD